MFQIEALGCRERENDQVKGVIELR
jgi:hypothetical protein